MRFDITPDEARETWKQFLQQETRRGKYIIQIYIDTDSTCGFIDESDVIFLFDTSTNQMCACIERIEKRKYGIFERLKIELTGKRKLAAAEHGVETYVYKKGDFIEYQMYKRWWYDIAHDTGEFNFISDNNT